MPSSSMPSTSWPGSWAVPSASCCASPMPTGAGAAARATGPATWPNGSRPGSACPTAHFSGWCTQAHIRPVVHQPKLLAVTREARQYALVKRDVDAALRGFGGVRFLRTSASRKVGRSNVRSAWFRLASVAAALCLVVGCSSSGSPRDRGLAARLQRSVDEFLSSRLVPGASVAVIDDGKLISVTSGFTDLEDERAVARDTQFRIASVTKLYLASLALRLVERDKLSLDEPIGVWSLALPPKLDFARELTLRQLLSHTSGIDQTFTRDEDRHRALRTADLLERIPPPVCRPSSCWTYADGNYVLVQLVLEAAAAQPLTTLVRDELAEPLGLRRTVVVDAANVDTVLPSQYALVSNDEGDPLEPRHLFEQSLPRSSTLITSAAEAARFADALLAGDLLAAASLETMLDTSAMRDLPCPHGCPFDYGLGVFHYDIAGHELVGHDGSSGAMVVHDRARGVTIAILSNGGEQDISGFLETVLSAVDANTRTSIS